MSYAEFDIAESAPNEWELNELGGPATNWLDENGLTFIDDGIDVKGLKDGYPITDGLIWQEYTVSGEALEAIAPQAKTDLQLAGSLKLTSFLPHYEERLDGKLAFVKPSLRFLLTRPSMFETGDQDEDLYIESDAESGAISSGRTEHTGQADEDEYAWVSTGSDEGDLFLQAASGNLLKSAKDNAHMTRKEHAALLSITNQLDELKAYDDQMYS